MLELLETSRAEEAGRGWIGQPGRTSLRLKTELHKGHRGAGRKAKTVTRKRTDHEPSPCQIVV